MDDIQVSRLAQEASDPEELDKLARKFGWTPGQHRAAVLERFGKGALSKSSYSGQPNSEYLQFLRYQSNKLKAKIIDDLDDSIRETMGRISHRSTIGLNKKSSGYGLVVGRIQSGKTSHMIGLAYLALDRSSVAFQTHFDTVIVLSGLVDDLRKQTISRFVDCQIKSVSVTLPGKDLTENQEERQRIIRDVKKGRKRIIIVKKNHLVIEKLCEIISELKFEFMSRRVLIIDDECDHASIDSRHAESDAFQTTKLDMEITKTNQALRRLMKMFRSPNSLAPNWYLGYTATPYSNLLLDPEPDGVDPEFGPTLFPRDVVHCLDQATNHLDNEYYFGTDNNKVVLTETPEENSGSEQEHLRRILFCHVISKIIKKERGIRDHHTTMIHSDRSVEDHHRLAVIMNELMEEALLMNEDQISNEILAYSRADFSDHSESVKKILSEYKRSEHRSIKREFSSSQIVELNRASWDEEDPDFKYPDELNYDSPEKKSIIVMGGDRLSRGLTLEGLTISWFSRSSKTPKYDTMLQMSRWCGYRLWKNEEGEEIHYDDLVRIFTSKELAEKFQLITIVEKELRAKLESFTKETNPLSEYQWIKEFRGMEISGKLPEELETRSSPVSTFLSENWTKYIPSSSPRNSPSESVDGAFNGFFSLYNLHIKPRLFMNGSEIKNFEVALGLKGEHIAKFMSEYRSQYDRITNPTTKLIDSIIDHIDSGSLSALDWNVAIHTPNNSSNYRGFSVSTNTVATGSRFEVVGPPHYNSVDLEIQYLKERRDSALLTILLEDPSAKFAGVPHFGEIFSTPVVFFGIFLPHENLDHEYILKARTGAFTD